MTASSIDNVHINAFGGQGVAAVCDFMTTGGGSCQLRAGDGLPVELLQFGAE